MKRLMQAATLALLMVPVLAVPSLAAPAGVPAVAPAQAPATAVAPAPALRTMSTTLEDEIFLNAGTSVPAFYGVCSQSCAPCWSTSGCPKDDDGTRQFCVHYCP